MELPNKKLLMFVHDLYEEMELHYPRFRMIEAGAKVVVAGPEASKEYSGKHGYPCKADVSIRDINESEFHGLIIPGGYAPDKLRKDPKVIELTRQFHQKSKMIAFICHAGWIPASANILKGVRCTSYDSIKDDLIHAGANWVDESVVVDRHIISSRFPADLPGFCQAIIKFLQGDKKK